MRKKPWLIGLGICIGIGGIIEATEEESAPTKPQPAPAVEQKKKPADEKSTADSDNMVWKEQFSLELAEEIAEAFTEIGEKPENIESIEYNIVREMDLFDRKNYVVTFTDSRKNLTEVFDSDKMGWVHHPTYLITTEEWHEGEPERAQYPREYLVSIKYWNGEDITTNVLQWSHTGNGELQK